MELRAQVSEGVRRQTLNELAMENNTLTKRICHYYIEHTYVEKRWVQTRYEKKTSEMKIRLDLLHHA